MLWANHLARADAPYAVHTQLMDAAIIIYKGNDSKHGASVICMVQMSTSQSLS